MTTEEAIALRKALGLTQNDMAIELGMNIRSWQEIEAGRTKLKRIHELALERVALNIGVGNKMIEVVPAKVRRDAVELSRLILGDDED